MQMVILTAVGIGGATVFGAAAGFLFKKISHRFTDMVLGFAAGIMLSAAIIGLILPSLEYVGRPWGFVVTTGGIFCGAACLSVLDKVVPHLHRLAGAGGSFGSNERERLNKVLLFVMAIAIHNLPEGLAAGVSFGTGNVSDAFLVAGGIALQNIPEGMVIIGPMLAVGVSPMRTFITAVITGIVEVIGTMLGFFAVSVSSFILPFALAFAGGTMLYVVSDEMIPETHSHGNERGATYALIIGFCVMIGMNYFLR